MSVFLWLVLCVLVCVLGCGGCVSVRSLFPHRSAGGSHAGGGGESRRCVQPDTEVACRVRDGTGAWTWILGTVLRYAADTKKYEVLDAGEVEDEDDEDDEDGGGGGGGAAAGEKRRSGHAPQSKYVWCCCGLLCAAHLGRGGCGRGAPCRRVVVVLLVIACGGGGGWWRLRLLRACGAQCEIDCVARLRVGLFCGGGGCGCPY